MRETFERERVSWSFGPPTRARARTRTSNLHAPLLRSLRVQRTVRRVDHVRVEQTAAPALGPPTLGIDTVVRRLAARPALALLGLCVCAALGAHGALALGSASLRPKRVHKERVAMTVAATPVDEILEEPAPPPPPPPSASAPVANATPARADAPAAPPTPGVSIAPALTSGGGGGGPAIAGGGGSPGAAAPAASSAAAPREAPVTPPRAHPRSPPRYPAHARAQSLEGRVVLHVLVDARGRVADVKVLESDPSGIFDAAAIEAARRWTFAPATKAGAAVDAWVRQVVRFTLD